MHFNILISLGLPSHLLLTSSFVLVSLPPHHLAVFLPSSSIALPHRASVILTPLFFLSPDCKYLSIPAWGATSYLAGHILCCSICWPDLQFHFINAFISLLHCFLFFVFYLSLCLSVSPRSFVPEPIRSHNCLHPKY